MSQLQQRPEKPWLPDQKLCAVLNDMREARQKQLDVGESLRGGVPRRWWGAQAGSGLPKLGSRLQIIQVMLCTLARCDVPSFTSDMMPQGFLVPLPVQVSLR